MDEYALFEGISNAINAYCFELLSATVQQVHFVQVGAHDGVTDDPIDPFIRRHHWKGVRVEPVPTIFSRLQANCRDLAEVQLLQAVCARTTTPRPFYTVDPGPDEFWSFLSSFNKSVILQHEELVPDLRARLRENTILTMTVQQVIESSRLEGLDLLCVDAEGHDDEVVLSLDFSQHRPRLIYLEHKHLQDYAFRNMSYFLRDMGYTPLRLYTDTFFVSDSFIGVGKMRMIADGMDRIFMI